jgi:hypothetical protein
MKRATRLFVATALAFVASGAIATAAIQSGAYSGSTIEDGYPVKFKVGKKPGKNGKWVLKSTIDYSTDASGECDEFTYGGDAKIKDRAFKVVYSFSGTKVATFKGEFVEDNVISGKVESIFCSGSDQTYVASTEPF